MPQTNQKGVEQCHECDGTGWFSPTIHHGDGWSCYCCGGSGKLPKGTYEALEARQAENNAAREQELSA